MLQSRLSLRNGWLDETPREVRAEQRQALGEILGHVFPVKWKSFDTAVGDIDKWTFDKDHAHATLNEGKTAEIKLTRFQGMTNEAAVLKNVKYWGTPPQRRVRYDAERNRGLTGRGRRRTNSKGQTGSC